MATRRKAIPEKRKAIHLRTNLILGTIPKSEYEALAPSLESIPLEWHGRLLRANEHIDFGYFPSGGVISFVVPMSDGRSAEVGMVGREGFVGAPLAGGLDRSPHVALVQIAAQAMRIRPSC